MEQKVRISAVVSKTTKDLLERHVRATGVNKSYLVEQALRHHLHALQELPEEFIVHPRIVVTRASGELMLKKIKSGRANKALRDLMRGED